MRPIRKISSLVSVLLALLLFAGNSGYTFIFHNCDECLVQEARHSIEIAAHGKCCLCGELIDGNQGNENSTTVMRHHCHHEIDRLVTSDLVKTDLHFDIFPQLTAISVIYLPPQEKEIKTAYSRTINFKATGRDLAKLYCQMLS